MIKFYPFKLFEETQKSTKIKSFNFSDEGDEIYISLTIFLKNCIQVYRNKNRVILRLY
jgi:hypothetical protein